MTDPSPAMLLPIFLIVLVDVFAFTLILPLLAIYAEHLGATALQATLLVSIFAACQLVSGPLLGRKYKIAAWVAAGLGAAAIVGSQSLACDSEILVSADHFFPS